jgi:putative ABC transport system permease protein
MSWPRPGLILRLFFRASRVQKKRAVLTIASIAWGSLSMILLLSFGEGLRIQLYRSSMGMGKNLAIMWPGETSEIWQGLPSGRRIRPRIEDVELLKQRLNNVAGVSGEIQNWGVVIEQGATTVTGAVLGTSPDYGTLRNQIPKRGGRYLNALDHKLRRRTVFLGDALAQQLFAEQDPVGREIKLNGAPYTVVGVMQPKIQMGNYGGMDEDHAVIPISTYKAQFGRDTLSVLVASPSKPEQMDAMLKQLNEVLGAKYVFNPEDERVFGVWNTVRSSAELVNMLLGIQIFLGIIGGLTLVVGGIGVANIMYAVVKERTREIGVKMAMGARSSWVTGPIVLEGLLYTIFGGVVGLSMAVVVVMLLGMLPTGDNEALIMLGKPTLSLTIGYWAAGILGTLGLAAGYFPARRAARIDPAETLRYE